MQCCARAVQHRSAARAARCIAKHPHCAAPLAPSRPPPKGASNDAPHDPLSIPGGGCGNVGSLNLELGSEESKRLKTGTNGAPPRSSLPPAHPPCPQHHPRATRGAQGRVLAAFHGPVQESTMGDGGGAVDMCGVDVGELDWRLLFECPTCEIRTRGVVLCMKCNECRPGACGDSDSDSDF